MDSSTRITCGEVVGLCEAIHAANPDLPAFGVRVLGVFLCVRLTLTYLRHNLPQDLLTELYCVSQATASRVIGAYTPLIAQALQVSSPGFCGGWFIWCRWLPVVIVSGGGGRVPRRLRARRGCACR